MCHDDVTLPPTRFLFSKRDDTTKNGKNIPGHSFVVIEVAHTFLHTNLVNKRWCDHIMLYMDEIMPIRPFFVQHRSIDRSNNIATTTTTTKNLATAHFTQLAPVIECYLDISYT